MRRRTFLAGLYASGRAFGESIRIIDAHTHFYDPTRPQGVPWPPKDESILYRTVLPQHFRDVTKGLGVDGTVVVEASPWLEDNQWILDLAETNRVIVGFVGHLNPGTPEFRRNLKRFHKSRIFRGIRIGSDALAGGDAFLADMKRLADADLALDVIGGRAIGLDLLRLNDHVPKLRIVINHMPEGGPAGQSLDEFTHRPQVYAKVSGVLRRVEGQVPAQLNFYRESVDRLWSAFGPDRLIYASNWPVCELLGSYELVLTIVRQYFAEKGAAASEKFFRGNALAAYKCVERQ